MPTEHTKTIRFNNQELGRNQGLALVLLRKALDFWFLEIGYEFKNWKIELQDSTVLNGQRVLKYSAVYDPGWRNLSRSFVY